MKALDSQPRPQDPIVGSGRRRFLKTALAAGGVLGWSSAPASLAAGAGRAVFGFQAPPSFTHLLDAILVELQGRYRPDLGSTPVTMPGGSGAVAVELVLRAPADGGTVLIAPSASLTLLPTVRQGTDHPVDHLVPVAGIGSTTLAFIVGPAVPMEVRTINDYFAWAQVNPTLGTYGVTGLGTPTHFVAREVANTARVSLKAVNYRGTQPMFDDVAAGTMPAAFTAMPDTDFTTKYPKVRLLAVSSDQRWPGLPDVPTLTELRLLKSPTVGSLGFFFVEGTPAAKIDQLATAVRSVTAQPAILQGMARINMRPMPSTGPTYPALLAEERGDWLDLVRQVERGGAR